MMKRRSLPLDCPFPPLPKCSREELEDLCRQYKLGGVTKDDLILNLLAVAKSILLNMMARCTPLRIQYSEVANQVIVRTCELVNGDFLDTVVDNQVCLYYGTLVRHVVGNCLQENMLQTRENKRYAKRTKQADANQELLTDESAIVSLPPEYDLIDELQSIAQNDKEQTYLDLKLQNFSDVEIAEKLGISLATCYNYRNTLRSRYEDRQ
jgi:hypothetical protein